MLLCSSLCRGKERGKTPVTDAQQQVLAHGIQHSLDDGEEHLEYVCEDVLVVQLNAQVEEPYAGHNL